MEQNEEKNNKIRISTPAAIVTAGVIIALAVVFTNRPIGMMPSVNKNTRGFDKSNTINIEQNISVRENDHIEGDIKKAEVVIFEYSDSDCPFCQRFHQTIKQVRLEYGDKLAWVYRHYPLTSLHPNALNEAIALECVADLGGNDAFWKYMETVINNTYKVEDKNSLSNLASSIGISKMMFDKCINDESISQKIKSSISEGQNLGAQGTPFSIVVNLKTKEKVEIPGAYPIEEVRNFIDSVL